MGEEGGWLSSPVVGEKGMTVLGLFVESPNRKRKYTEKTTVIRFLFLGGRKNGTFPSPRFAPKVDTGVTGTPALWRTQPYSSCGDRLIA